MSYKSLEVWKLSRLLVIDIPKMILTKLPKFEMYEKGSQIRRSSKSVKSTIVEGYGRRNYQQDYKRFLTYAIASNDETIDYLENLFETGSLKEKLNYEDLHSRIFILGKKLNKFIQSIEKDLRAAKSQRPEASVQQPAPSD